MKKNKFFEILAIGLDSIAIEVIKKTLKANGFKYKISFISEIDELSGMHRKSIEAVFYFSNKQSHKIIQDVRKISMELPRAAITLLSSRVDLGGAIGAFRAGLFDLLTVPLDPSELRSMLFRLQLHEVMQSGHWNPERAVLHLFSRPESFSSLEDISITLNQYLNLFFEIEKHTFFANEVQMVRDLKLEFNLNSHQQKRIKRFIGDSSGLIFGLRFIEDRFHFLIKTGPDKFSYLVAVNQSVFSVTEILSDYLSNVLRTSLSILTESKARQEIKLLSLTDEVTGLFNQRKLTLDLDYYISGYPIDKQVFSLLFIDIDYFKNVNDKYGHVVGSQLLIDMAAVLKTQLRASDLVYRYGGDEFIVLLPKSNLIEAKKIAIRISECVKAAEFKIEDGTKYNLSLSIGIAEYPSDATSAKSIIEFADKMMYLSKKSGRGKVFHVNEVVA